METFVTVEFVPFPFVSRGMDCIGIKMYSARLVCASFQ